MVANINQEDRAAHVAELFQERAQRHAQPWERVQREFQPALRRQLAVQEVVAMRAAVLTFLTTLLLATNIRADDDTRCTCTPAQRDWFRAHPHKNRFFGNVERCCNGWDCHCLDRGW